VGGGEGGEVARLIVVGVDPAEAQAHLRRVELRQPLAVHAHHDVALGPGLRGAAGLPQRLGEPSGGALAKLIEMRVEHGYVGLLLLHILLSHTLQGKQPVRLRAPRTATASACRGGTPGSQAVPGRADAQTTQARWTSRCQRSRSAASTSSDRPGAASRARTMSLTAHSSAKPGESSPLSIFWALP